MAPWPFRAPNGRPNRIPWSFAGPWATSVGVGRAEPEWAKLNKVTDTVGTDAIFQGGDTTEAPLKLPDAVMKGDLASAPAQVDLLIVGAGLSGAVLAERCSKELGMTSLMIDVRDHIGGNCYDYVEEHGLRASKYGAHLFHTKFERVWDYVTQFSEWIPFDHRVKGRVPDEQGVSRLVPIPPTQETVNTLFGASIGSEEEMSAWYDANRKHPPEGAPPANGEEAALSRVGPRLYEAIFKHYTKKQWDKYPAELDASVLMRLPCRTSTDDRYFGDDWQALPRRGYTRIFENSKQPRAAGAPLGVGRRASGPVGQWGRRATSALSPRCRLSVPRFSVPLPMRRKRRPIHLAAQPLPLLSLPLLPPTRSFLAPLTRSPRSFLPSPPSLRALHPARAPSSRSPLKASPSRDVPLLPALLLLLARHHRRVGRARAHAPVQCS